MYVVSVRLVEIAPADRVYWLMLLQVKSGSIFDNILVTDSLDEALKFGEETWGKIKDEEKAAFDKIKEVCDYCCHLGRSLH